MNGVAQMEIAWTARNQIPNIVQGPLSSAMPISTVSTARTRPFEKVAAALDDLWFRQILDSRDALGGIGQVLSRSRHGGALLGMGPQSPDNPRICTL